MRRTSLLSQQQQTSFCLLGYLANVSIASHGWSSWREKEPGLLVLFQSVFLALSNQIQAARDGCVCGVLREQ